MKAPPLPLEEAQARLLALVEPLPLERVDCENAHLRFLAQPLVARRTQPACDQSAMDGYAVQAASIRGPWRLVGESAAGHPFAGTVGAGEAVRISTGAMMPAGADAVVLQEDVARDGADVRLPGEPPSPPGKHVRRRGLDFAEGDQLLAPGTRLGAAHLALARASGHNLVPVHRLPRVTVIDSGDELAADAEACGAHQLPASNGAMLSALVREHLACPVTRSGPVADRLDALLAAFEATGDADVIVTSGGASVGDHDLIRPALEAWGADIEFWRVAIKPGKPILVARRGAQLVIGLPGNPVSSFVTAFLFVLPVLRRMAGASRCLPQRIPARLAVPLAPGGNRQEFLRASWDGFQVSTQRVQDSSALASLAFSNALIDRPAGAPAAPAGCSVPVYLLGNGGIA